MIEWPWFDGIIVFLEEKLRRGFLSLTLAFTHCHVKTQRERCCLLSWKNPLQELNWSMSRPWTSQPLELGKINVCLRCLFSYGGLSWLIHSLLPLKLFFMLPHFHGVRVRVQIKESGAILDFISYIPHPNLSVNLMKSSEQTWNLITACHFNCY